MTSRLKALFLDQTSCRLPAERKISTAVGRAELFRPAWRYSAITPSGRMAVSHDLLLQKRPAPPLIRLGLASYSSVPSMVRVEPIGFVPKFDTRIAERLGQLCGAQECGHASDLQASLRTTLQATAPSMRRWKPLQDRPASRLDELHGHAWRQ